ncbi:MAG TPA: branched-chain amino acid ABC transporter ATP-binding protein/permease [Syntrophomonadaceae bacterium]|nr:branched-chain amino acid ABC transporter ATP-binding protein/permease [Syntrophomonadaceae bacterium]
MSILKKNSSSTTNIGFNPSVSYLAFAVGVIIVILLPLIFTSRYTVNLIILASAVGISTLGLTVLLGYTGLVSLGHAVFYGIGAYGIALGTTRWGLNWWIALILSMAFVALIGLILGITTLKVSGHYLAVVTICVQIIFTLIATNWKAVTGGPDGISGIHRPEFIVSLSTSRNFEWFCLAVLLVAVTFVWNLKDRPLGRAMRAVRENELAAQVLGVDTLKIKVVAFILSAVFGGLGGAIYASGSLYISPDAFTFDQSVQFLAMCLTGGTESAIGSMLGAWLLYFLPEWLRQLKNIYLVVYGCIIIFVIVFIPEGLWGFVNLLYRKLAKPRPIPVSKQPLSLDIPETDIVLQVENLGKYFGGLKALDGVDFIVKRGEVHALIGPNGSGKSTLINVVSGVYSPTFGNVKFLGKEVTGMRPCAVAQMGLSRTFQNLRLFNTLTVYENVLVASQRSGGSIEEVHERAIAAIEFVGLREKVHEQCKNLPYGHQKLVELARALAGRPKLLLLDEPAAGLNQTEKQDLVELLKKLNAMGLTMVLIEHDMSLVAQISNQATVLNFGKKISEGTMEHVLQDPVVVEAYIGKKEVALGA